jgi:hypothetical protein
MQLRSGLENPHAILREATSSLLPCDPLLISGNLVPGRIRGCGQPPELAPRSCLSLHLMTCTMNAPEFGSGHTMRRDCAGQLYQLHKRKPSQLLWNASHHVVAVSENGFAGNADPEPKFRGAPGDFSCARLPSPCRATASATKGFGGRRGSPRIDVVASRPMAHIPRGVRSKSA